MTIVDVSHWRRKIDFLSAKESGVELAIIKLTDGVYTADPFSGYNARGFRGHEIPVAFFHYWRALQDPRLQAETFRIALIGIARWEPTQEDIWIDCEDPRARSRAATSSSIETVVRETWEGTAVKPGIYTRASWWDSKVSRSDFWNQFPLWVAHYGVAVPRLPLDWQEYDLHQYSERGDVPGIRSPVDLNRRPPDPPPNHLYRSQVTAWALRIRGGPGLEHEILGRYVRGEVVWILNESGDWLQTEKGWIHGDYVRRF